MSWSTSQATGAASVSVGRGRYRIYALLFLLSVVSYIDRISISVGAKSIAQEFHLSPVAMGYLLSAFFWSYALCLIPVGMMADRWGARKTIAVCIALWSVMTAAAGFASNLTVLLLTRLGLGVGESAVFPAGSRVLREWTPASERGLAATVFIAGSYAGPAFGAALLGWVVSAFGWRGGFYVSGAVGLTYLAVWSMSYQRPEAAAWINADERAKILNERNARPVAAGQPATGSSAKAMSVFELLHSKTMWGLALAHGCGIYSQYLYLTWLPTYLVNVRGLTVLNAGLYTTIPYLAAAVLNVALGVISDRGLDAVSASRGQRRNLMAGLKLVSAVILLVPFVESTAAIMVLLTVSLSALSGAISLHYALMHDLLRNPVNAGKASSLVALGGNGFGLLAPIVTGYVIAGTGSYNWAFGTAGILLILGAGLLIALAREPIDQQRL
jgi:MFS family permease